MITLKGVLEETGQKTMIDFNRNLIGDYSFQAHLSDRKNISLENRDDFDEEDVEKMYNQPPGFWTGTVIKNVETFITDWINYGVGDEYFHGFTIVNNPNILRMKTPEDVQDVIQGEFGKDKGIQRDFDWVKISNHYDAVHVTGFALEDSMLEWWSTESTLWFRPKDYLKHQFTWKIDLDEIPDRVKDDPKGPLA